MPRLDRSVVLSAWKALRHRTCALPQAYCLPGSTISTAPSEDFVPGITVTAFRSAFQSHCIKSASKFDAEMQGAGAKNVCIVVTG